MAYNVTGLTEYIYPGENLLIKGILTQDFADFDLQEGNPHKIFINYLESTPSLSQTYCGTGTSTDKITEQEVEVAQYDFKGNICAKELQSYALQNFDVPTVIAENVIDGVKTKVWSDLWVGSTAGTDYIDGWLTIASGATDVIDATSVAITIDNIDDIVNDMIAKAYDSESLMSRSDLTIYMNMTNFNLYKQNQISANMFMLAKSDFGPNEMWATGYDGIVKIKSFIGIGSNSDMILTWSKNLLISTDEIAMISNIEFKEDSDRSVNYFVDFMLGAAIKYTNEVVYFTEP